MAERTMTARANLLASILRERIMVLDGAMGTMIQKRKLVESDYRGARFREHHKELKGANDVLCLTRPDLIREIHCAYLAAGADIIETNTFNSTRIALEDFGLEGLAREMNAAAARIARSACDEFEAKDPSKPRFVAGSLGPTNRSASISPDVENPAFRSVSFDDLVEAYSEQLRGLIEGGADLLFIETVFDTLNAKSALVAAERVFEELGARLPVVVSGTITDASGRTLSGQTVEAFWNSICHADLLAVGFNCALGAKEMRPHVEELSALAWTNIVCYPNAGLPNAFGEYDETPEVTASIVGAFADDGLVTIVGGCCGTTPEHIAAIARRVAGARPRAVPERKRCLRLSGLEALTVFPGSNFINVGERTNVAGSAKFAKFIREGDYDAALAVARQQVENGAQVIDISMDEALIDSEKAMVRFLNLLASDPDICRVPFMIDSSRWDVLAAGLKCVQGKAIVNSISLKEGEAAFLAKAKLLRRYGAAAVVMAFDEEGQAVTAARKIEICRRAYRLMIERAGFPPEDIIFDPNILTVATGMEEHNDYAKNFFEALEAIKRELPHASTSGGVSNVSFAFRGKNALREAMHSVFLYHAIRAGLDMAIVNAGALPVYEEIDPALCGLIEDVLLNRRADATERLIAFAGEMGAGPSTVQNEEEWRGLPVGERLAHALVKGKTEFLDEDLGAAIHEFGDPLRIIEGPLMDGMKRVGELFGAGKMFLPQVVKTARVMKRAVGILMPDLEARRKDGSASSAGTIVLATVKGDVHDIGKNIVSVVLACNNFRVVDLGVMVPSNAIIDAVKRERADLLGLSGLITPSLEEMAHVARDMEREGIRIPLLIGGATTSKTHTAVKIAPERSSATVHVPDASQAVTVAAGLMDAARCDAVTAELTREYAAIRENFGKRASAGLLPLAEARARAHRCDWTKAAIVRPSYFGAKRFDAIAVSDAAARIDWTPFFHAWELKGRYPSVLDDPACGEAARRLYDDARAMLERMEGRITLRAAVGFYPAGSAGDDIVLFEDDARATRIGVVHTLRQQMDRGANAAMALSDFIAPLDSEHRDYLGLFCVNAGTGLEEMLAEFEREKDDYSSILAKALCDRLAEALAELMHEKARKELWGYAPDEALTNEELIAEKYRGIRPAPGYPSCPMHDEKTLIFELLAANEIGMSLTETLAMIPAPSVSGMYFANPEARYFGVGRIGRDQAEDYLRRRNEKASEMQSRFGSLLAES